MRLRCLYSLFTVCAVVLASGCCCGRHWGERRACRPSYRVGSPSCESCSSHYTPCDCNAPLGPPIFAPTPIGPMPKAGSLSLSRQ